MLILHLQQLSWALSQHPSWQLFHQRDLTPLHQRSLRFSKQLNILFSLFSLLNHLGNLLFSLMLQPDITAPGVSVIAAYTEAQGPTNQDFDKRRVLFNSVSGTSMSCPHVSGIVGLLKTLHPDWSPAAIRSAMMTTGQKTLQLPNACCLAAVSLILFS